MGPMTKPRKRVIAVGMFDSVHFGGWLHHFREEKIDFLLFPSSPNRRVHQSVKNLVTGETEATYSLFAGAGAIGLPLWVLDRALGNILRATLLRILVKKFQPDIVHCLELQNAGYVASKAFRKLPEPKPMLVATNYGSDIFWFKRFPKHAKLLAELMVQVDGYAAECERDVELARELGFNKKIMPVLPNAGGFSRAQLDGPLNPVDRRKLIMVKGYHGWVGRAHIALKALEAMSPEIQSYEIVVFSCNVSTKILAHRMAQRTGLRVSSHLKGALRHDQMLEMYSEALVYVGLSLSDGISTSMLEAMAMGAIPVQTATACCDEWFSETGVAIRNLCVQEVETGIRAAIEIATTTDFAIENRKTVQAKASREEIAKQAISFYELEGTRIPPSAEEARFMEDHN